MRTAVIKGGDINNALTDLATWSDAEGNRRTAATLWKHVAHSSSGTKQRRAERKYLACIWALAKVAREKGDIPKSRQLLEEYVELDDTKPKPLTALAAATTQLEDWAEAVELWKRVSVLHDGQLAPRLLSLQRMAEGRGRQRAVADAAEAQPHEAVYDVLASLSPSSDRPLSVTSKIIFGGRGGGYVIRHSTGAPRSPSLIEKSGKHKNEVEFYKAVDRGGLHGTCLSIPSVYHISKHEDAYTILMEDLAHTGSRSLSALNLNSPWTFEIPAILALFGAKVEMSEQWVSSNTLDNDPPSLWFYSKAYDRLTVAETYCEKFLADTDLSDLHAFEMLRSLFGQYGSIFPLFKNVTGLSHGDFNQNNILRDTNGVYAIFDFSMPKIAPLGLDAGYLLARLVAATCQQDPYFGRQLDAATAIRAMRNFTELYVVARSGLKVETSQRWLWVSIVYFFLLRCPLSFTPLISNAASKEARIAHSRFYTELINSLRIEISAELAEMAPDLKTSA